MKTFGIIIVMALLPLAARAEIDCYTYSNEILFKATGTDQTENTPINLNLYAGNYQLSPAQPASCPSKLGFSTWSNDSDGSTTADGFTLAITDTDFLAVVENRPDAGGDGHTFSLEWDPSLDCENCDNQEQVIDLKSTTEFNYSYKDFDSGEAYSCDYTRAN